MKITALATAIGFAVLTLGSLAYAAELDVTIEKASPINPYQIALVPFAGDNGMTTVIGSNLNFTELKTTSQNLPQRPLSVADFGANRAIWQHAGFSYVVVGATQTVGNGKAQINYEVIEVATGRVVGGRQTQMTDANANGYRFAANVISDKIYELITGTPGDFSGRIAFVEETGDPRNKTSTLKVMDADGQNVRVLHQVQGSIFSPTWSPDGKRVAYSVQLPKGLPVIYIREVDVGGQQLVTVTPFKGNNLGASFSPDGANLLFSGSHEDNDPAIYQLHLASRNVKKLTNMAGAENSPSYAADGRSFVFTADNGSRTPQLYRYDFNTGQVRRIAGAAVNPRQSSDGKIAYVSGSSLVVMNAAGGTQNIGVTGMHESATFSPNNTRIAYSSYQGGQGVLTIRSLTTGQSFSKTTNGKVREPAWSPARSKP
ncbi:MAG: TolB family protein [Moraxella sp.]|nr:TolB family protein [Moraxella sp.]